MAAADTVNGTLDFLEAPSSDTAMAASDTVNGSLDSLEPLLERGFSLEADVEANCQALAHLWSCHYDQVRQASESFSVGDPPASATRQRFELGLSKIEEQLTSIGSHFQRRDVLGFESFFAQLWTHLADLSRYRGEHQQMEERRRFALDVAEELYWQAILTFPQAGHAFNQLGIMANAESDLLGASVYYLRSLLCTKPFTSHGNLVGVLHHMASVETQAGLAGQLPPRILRRSCLASFAQLQLLLLDGSTNSEKVTSQINVAASRFVDLLTQVHEAPSPVEWLESWLFQIMLFSLCAVLYQVSLVQACREKVGQDAVNALLPLLGTKVDGTQLRGHGVPAMGAWRWARRMVAVMVQVVPKYLSPLWSAIALFGQVVGHFKVWHEESEMDEVRSALVCVLRRNKIEFESRLLLHALPEDEQLSGLISLPVDLMAPDGPSCVQASCVGNVPSQVACTIRQARLLLRLGLVAPPNPDEISMLASSGCLATLPPSETAMPPSEAVSRTDHLKCSTQDGAHSIDLDLHRKSRGDDHRSDGPSHACVWTDDSWHGEGASGSMCKTPAWSSSWEDSSWCPHSDWWGGSPVWWEEGCHDSHDRDNHHRHNSDCEAAAATLAWTRRRDDVSAAQATGGIVGDPDETHGTSSNRVDYRGIAAGLRSVRADSQQARTCRGAFAWSRQGVTGSGKQRCAGGARGDWKKGVAARSASPRLVPRGVAAPRQAPRSVSPGQTYNYAGLEEEDPAAARQPTRTEGNLQHGSRWQRWPTPQRNTREFVGGSTRFSSPSRLQ